MIKLRTPTPDELPALCDLCMRSKVQWGYDEAFMEICLEELTFLPADLKTSFIQIAETDKRILGVAHVIPQGDNTELEKLFIDPDQFSSGVGRLLFNWAVKKSQEQGASHMHIISDPAATGFYTKMGAILVGENESPAIPGRYLPQLIFNING